MVRLSMTRAELDKGWEELRQLLRAVNPTKIVASLLAHASKEFPKEGIPFDLDGYAIQIALLRLKASDEKYALMLQDFIFSSKGPFPVTRELDDALPRLLLSRSIRVPNPDFNRIEITEENRAKIFAREKRWCTDPVQQELIAEMGKEYARLIKEADRQLKEERRFC